MNTDYGRLRDIVHAASELDADAREAFRLAAAKLPIQTAFVTRQVM